MPIRKLALAAAVLAATSAHAQYGMEQMMNPMTMMNPAMMMNPMSMGMMNPAMMMNPMSMMMPMTMMMAPMGMGMMNPMSMVSPMGGFGGPSPQQMLSNPYLNPMGTANPYLAPQSPVQTMPGFFPMMPAAPAATPSYGAPAYGYYPQPQPATPSYGTPAYGYYPQPQPAAPSYGVPAYGYYPQPAAPQPAPAAMPWDPSAWMQMYSAPVQQAPAAPQR